MFRKLFALEVAALSSGDEAHVSSGRDETEIVSSIREVFAPRTGNYGSMWSRRAAG